METLVKRDEKRSDEVEERVRVWTEEELEERIDALHNYARRIHSGLVWIDCERRFCREKHQTYTLSSLMTCWES